MSQAGPAPCTLVASATGMRQYTVFAFRLRLIAAINRLLGLASALEIDADTGWLQSISVY